MVPATPSLFGVSVATRISKIHLNTDKNFGIFKSLRQLAYVSKAGEPTITTVQRARLHKENLKKQDKNAVKLSDSLHLLRQVLRGSGTISERRRKGIEIVELINKSGHQLNNMDQYRPVLSFYASIGQPEKITALFDELRASKLELTTSLCNELLGSLCQVGLKHGLTFYRGFPSFNIVPDLDTYSILIKWCRRHNDAKHLELIYQEVKKHGLVMNRSVSDSLISAFSQLSKAELAYLVYTEVNRVNRPLDKTIYTVLIQALTKVSMTEQALKVYRDMTELGIKPDVVFFNTLINTCLRSNDRKNAISLFEKMVVDGVKPDVVTYNTLISAFTKLHDSQTALRFFRDMTERNIKGDVITYSSLIRCFGSKMDVVNISKILQEMRKSKITPNLITFTTLISVYGRTGNLKLIEQTYQDLVKSKLRPDAILYNSLIHAFAKNGGLSYAGKLFNEMKAQGFKPDNITFSNMIEGYIRKHDLIQAQAVYDSMLANDVVPDLKTKTTLIKGYLDDRQVKKAETLFKAIATPDTALYNIMIRGYINNLDYDRSTEVYDRMKESSTAKPDIITITILINGFMQRGRYTEALRIYESTKHEGKIKLDLTVFTSLISGLAKCGQVQSAQKIYDDMKAFNLRPDTHVISALLDMYIKRKDFTSAKETLLQASKSQITPDLCLLTNIMDYHLRVQEHDNVVKTWDKAQKTFHRSSQAIKYEALNASISVLLDSYGRFSDLAKLQKAWASLKMKYPLDENNYNSYVEALCRHQQFQQATSVVCEMANASHKTFLTILDPLIKNAMWDQVSIIAGKIKTESPELLDGLEAEFGENFARHC